MALRAGVPNIYPRRVTSRANDAAARQKELEFEASRLAAIVTSSEDAIVSKDLNGIIQSWNPAAERMFGYTAAEVVGKSIRIIVPADRQQEEDEVLARIRAGRSIEHFETVRVRKDGTFVDISLSVSPVKNAAGHIIGASKIARDITAQKALIREIEEANRLKDEFLATLSHELRTPLNALMGYARMLRSGHIAAERIPDVLAIVDRNAGALSKLVSDVLDMSAIVTGKTRVRLTDCDLVPVIRDALEVVRPGADAKRVRLVLTGDEPPLPVYCDTDRMRQVFWNLLNNAVKFTGQDGEVAVRISHGARWADIVVEDTGIGIHQSFLPFVFERFRQGHRNGGLSREGSGLGLGLSLVRHYVELHGGRVAVSSEGEGRGARFTVTLPLRSP